MFTPDLHPEEVCPFDLAAQRIVHRALLRGALTWWWKCAHGLAHEALRPRMGAALQLTTLPQG